MNTAMEQRFTIREAVDWIIKNRKNDAFKNYPPEKIAMEIRNAIINNCFYHSVSDTGELNGIVCARLMHNGEGKEVVFIDDILTTEKKVLSKFIKYYMTVYPKHPIMGVCRGRIRIFRNPHKLERRIK